MSRVFAERLFQGSDIDAIQVPTQPFYKGISRISQKGIGPTCYGRPCVGT
jgi:hypothetical protein